jgi:hypothetical protein
MAVDTTLRAVDSFGFVGNDLDLELYVEEDGAPKTGIASALRLTLTDPTGTTVLSSETPTEVGTSGHYVVNADGQDDLTVPGTYRQLWLDTTNDRRYDGPLIVRYPSGTVYSRLELRHLIAREVGDLTLGVSTGSNTTTTIKDTDRVEPDNHWRGSEVWTYAGTGRHLVESDARKITSSTQTGGVLTVGKAWSGTTPDSTSRYELRAWP